MCTLHNDTTVLQGTPEPITLDECQCGTKGVLRESPTPCSFI